jgi:hypothetical protein
VFDDLKDTILNGQFNVIYWHDILFIIGVMRFSHDVRKHRVLLFSVRG